MKRRHVKILMCIVILSIIFIFTNLNPFVSNTDTVLSMDNVEMLSHNIKYNIINAIKILSVVGVVFVVMVEILDIIRKK